MTNTEKANDVRFILSKNLSDYELKNLSMLKMHLKNDIARLLNNSDINTLKAIKYLLENV